LYTGVSKCAKDGRWQSRIRVGKKVKYLGRFRTEMDAAKKYDEVSVFHYIVIYANTTACDVIYVLLI
jgi:hypothetical protein